VGKAPKYKLAKIKGVRDTPGRVVRLLEMAGEGDITVRDDLDRLERESPISWRNISGAADLFTQAMPGDPWNTERYHGYGPQDWDGAYVNCFQFKDHHARWRLFGFILRGERPATDPRSKRKRFEVVICVDLRQVSKSGGARKKGQQTDKTALNFVNQVREIREVEALAEELLKEVTS